MNITSIIITAIDIYVHVVAIIVLYVLTLDSVCIECVAILFPEIGRSYSAVNYTTRRVNGYFVPYWRPTRINNQVGGRHSTMLKVI